MRPPMLVAPERSRCSASPLGQRPRVFIPVQFQGGGQVVDLGQGQVFGPDAGFGVGGVEDLVFEHPVRAGDDGGGGRWRYRAVRVGVGGIGGIAG